MKPNTGLFIAFLFFDVVALAWAAWEFRSARPGKVGGETPPADPLSPEDARHPEGEHRPHDRRA